MILTTAAVFIATGIALFGLGQLFDRPELAMFGALIVIGVGATGAVNGFEVQTGEMRHVNNTSDGETVTVNQTYSDIDVHSDFPLDIVLLLLGAVMLIGASGEASEAETSSPPWQE